MNIHPPPWFTWWAYLIYLSLLILVIFSIVKNKTSKQKKINAYLNEQVHKKTEHIKKQKDTVELLMKRRNEIFSNVTHEFRTPITLIQGPISQLEKNTSDKSNLKMILMIKRNSDRLLRLVNQMLAVSHIIEDKNQIKHQIQLASQLKLVIAPYQYLVKSHKKKLVIQNIDDVTLCLSDDTLEIIIGNFLSNAIKYSGKSEYIIIGTKKHNDEVEIFVQDQGEGLTSEQKDLIFQRFTRLDNHHDIQGAGIGLSLAKEIAELNGAKIHVNSDIGKGSQFSVIFPIYKMEDRDNSYNKNINNDISLISDNPKHKATVLIIEDNNDMRNYIETILSDNFSCLLARDGKEGINIAINNVPDVIICDVMMPGIDGYHVCRTIRNEMITSHIPLILLTALIDKAHRIQGWKEKIDMYICKPFDADELNHQVINILNIRNMIKKQNNNSFNEKEYSVFSQQDQKFIQNLNSIIEDNYDQNTFGLDDISQQIFLSDRQLQRKTKALLNMSPLDLLRDHRFKKATEMLKQGYQISIVSDNCGFSSLSYFSQSFKKRYGMTAKQYQKTTN